MRVLALLAIVTILACSQNRLLSVGDAAPNFRATVAGTNQYRNLADLKGKVVILSVVSSACEPCRDQLSGLQRLQDSLGATGKVLVIAEDSVANSSMAETVKGIGLTLELLHDPDGAVERAYQVRGYPEMFVIDRDGVLRNHWIGTNDWSLSESMRAVRVLRKAD